MIFVAGVHGVGKTYFCNTLSNKINLNVYSASNLISEIKDEENSKNKSVKTISNNQIYLISAIERIKEPNYILDGHFCLIDTQSIVQKISQETFINLSIQYIVVLYDEVQNILRRLEKRDGINHEYAIFEKLQQTELEYAKEISIIINKPIFFIKFCEDYSEVLESLLKDLN